jgi:hypothetical protein
MAARFGLSEEEMADIKAQSGGEAKAKSQREVGLAVFHGALRGDEEAIA